MTCLPTPTTEMNMATKLSVKQKLFLGLTLLMGLAALYWILMETGALSVVTDKQALREWVDRLGVWGPFGYHLYDDGCHCHEPDPQWSDCDGGWCALRPSLGDGLCRYR